MSIKNFKFVSPGVFINEIDNSQLPNEPTARGPLVIGRTARGPAMVPYQVDSFAEFVRAFGNPVPGNKNTDVWRNGNQAGPTYAAYAAQAWLANNSPVTMLRLLGDESPNNDGLAASQAGWTTTNTLGPARTNGGAYGLFMIDTTLDTNTVILTSSTNELNYNFGMTFPSTGTLAAVWYFNDGLITLTGTSGYGDVGAGGQAGTLIPHSGTNLFIHSTAKHTFQTTIMDDRADAAGVDPVAEKAVFNFDENSDKYIRKVFNTNPILTNSDITDATAVTNYWLGETYERAVNDTCTGSNQWGVILPLAPVLGPITSGWENHSYGMRGSQTGWFFSQDLRTTAGSSDEALNVLTPIYQAGAMQKLFRLHSLEPGEWAQSNLKVSIENVKAATNKDDPYGTFTIRVRKLQDSDSAIQTVEVFANCNLNPNSENYIARVVGDKYRSWQYDDKRYTTLGTYNNKSKFLRIEMNADVDAGLTDPLYLPFGVYGHPKFQGFAFASGAVAPLSLTGAITAASTDVNEGTYVPTPALLESWGYGAGILGKGVVGTSDNFVMFLSASSVAQNYTMPFSGGMTFPSIPARSGALAPAVQSPKAAYFGVDTQRKSSTNYVLEFEKSCIDILRALPSTNVDGDPSSDPLNLEWSWVFTLDDLSCSFDTSLASWVSGSRAEGYSTTARSSSYKDILSRGYNKFTTVLYGGFDGLRIDESEPFRNTFLADGTETTNYAYNSVQRAIDSVKDAEVVDYNLAVMPGITNEALGDYLVATCEDRGDAMAILDLKGGYEPDTESTVPVVGSVTSTIDNLNDRGLNSSYGCGYYPWVQVRDSLNSAILWMPPSVVALGAMSFSEKKQELWFAPAGFIRGGLSQGAAGIPVVGVREQLTADQRDDLYEANVNPIASFPNEGIVIFGQKTLQVTRSALDRINVRRLMIYVKKMISTMANDILFDQNTITTWSRFISRANPFLDSVRSRLGLEDFKVILDNTTTTPDMRDRNIIYAKVFLKPTKAVEFIAIDFTITNSGASFED